MNVIYVLLIVDTNAGLLLPFLEIAANLQHIFDSANKYHVFIKNYHIIINDILRIHKEIRPFLSDGLISDYFIMLD